MRVMTNSLSFQLPRAFQSGFASQLLRFRGGSGATLGGSGATLRSGGGRAKTNLGEAQVGEAAGGTGLAVACPRQARQVPQGGEVVSS